MQLFHKKTSEMVNKVEPDQEQSVLGLHCLHVILSETLVYEILEHLPFMFQAYWKKCQGWKEYQNK